MALGAAGCGYEYPSIPPITTGTTFVRQGYRCPLLNARSFYCSKVKEELDYDKKGHPIRHKKCIATITK